MDLFEEEVGEKARRLVGPWEALEVKGLEYLEIASTSILRFLFLMGDKAEMESWDWQFEEAFPVGEMPGICFLGDMLEILFL